MFTQPGALVLLSLSLLADPPAASATQLWEQGQQAMLDDQTERAIGLFRQSLARDPSLACNHLSLAAAYLQKSDDEGAAPHLDRYLKARADHVLVRHHYAELLLKLNRYTDARQQFERFVAQAQDDEAVAARHLVNSHGRLMEIAEVVEDEYGEHLHRGIGLYLLALQRAELLKDAEPTEEGLLCRAAAELVLARQTRPDEARPCLYLHAVWSRLSQKQPADRWLRAAEEAAPFSDLTPGERRQLRLACQARDASHRR